MSAPSFLDWKVAAATSSVNNSTNIAGFVNAGNGGPGDTLADTAGTATLTVDGHVVVLGDRVLVWGQTLSWQNGIYVATVANSVFGQVATVTLTAGGTGFTNGQYYNLPTTTGGSGTGARVNVTVVGGIVTAIAVSVPGSGYALADTI